MAKKKDLENNEEVSDSDEMDQMKLSKLLIREFNKNQEKTGKLAWNLSTDLDNPTDVKEWISTGSTLLDYAISNRRNGGIPVGKLTEICGEEASGKSLLCAHLAAYVQKKGGIVVYIDTENAMNPDFMIQLGVDLNKLVYLQPGTVEEVGESIVRSILVTRQKAASKLVLIIWDSVAGTPTKAEIEGNIGELNMNDQLAKSKVLSKMMRQITETLGKERICLVFTNQLKTKIGVMYGDPMTTPGGKAIPYHASVRIRLNRGGTEKGEGDEKDDVMGVNTTAKLIKNRMGPPLRKAKFFISFARGIEDTPSWRDYLHSQGVIEKADGWCYLSELPSGKLEVKGTYEGKDRGIKFRESQWEDFVQTMVAFSPEQITKLHAGEKIPAEKAAGVKVKDWVLDQIEKKMVVKYGAKALDAELDPESTLEVEQMVQDILQS